MLRCCCAAENSPQDPIVVHVATERGQKFPFERLFRSAMCTLMDAAIQEYDFLVDFFGSGYAPPISPITPPYLSALLFLPQCG